LGHEKDSSLHSQKQNAPQGLLYTLFAFFGFLVGWSFSKLRTPKENCEQTIPPQDNTTKESHRAGIESPIISNIPPTPSQHNDPNRGKNDTPRWKKIAEICIAISTVGLLIVTGAYAVVSYCQWQQMREQTKVSQRQLEALDRPWLKVTFSAEPITFQQGGMQIGVRPHITNVGHSVATGVMVPTKIFLASDADDIFKKPLRVQKELCDPIADKSISGERNETQISIFPDSADNSLLLGQGFSRDEINSAPTANSHFTVKHLVPIMVGCVDYQYGTAVRHHQTRFIFEIFRSGAAPNTSIEVGKDVSASDVRLTPYPFGGFLAN